MTITPFNKKIGTRIRDFRKERKIEVEDMLLKLNISESTYLRMEKGETNTWATHLEKLCEIFEIEEEELLLSNELFTEINNFHPNNEANGVVIINNYPDNFYENIKKEVLESNAQKAVIAKLIEEIEILKKK
jgi:transcriptional regulator with XRE-family HTH domain